MAWGVRLHHPTLRNCMLTVEHPRQYTVPFLCPVCSIPDPIIPNAYKETKIHKYKTYHLRIDAAGDVIVSQQIADRLKDIQYAGLKVLNVVSSPPDQQLGVEVKPQDIFEKPLGGELRGLVF